MTIQKQNKNFTKAERGVAFLIDKKGIDKNLISKI